MNFETPLSRAMWAIDLAPVTWTELKSKFLENLDQGLLLQGCGADYLVS